jgi:hypothetical protein
MDMYVVRLREGPFPSPLSLCLDAWIVSPSVAVGCRVCPSRSSCQSSLWKPPPPSPILHRHTHTDSTPPPPPPPPPTQTKTGGPQGSLFRRCSPHLVHWAEHRPLLRGLRRRALLHPQPPRPGRVVGAVSAAVVWCVWWWWWWWCVVVLCGVFGGDLLNVS